MNDMDKTVWKYKYNRIRNTLFFDNVDAFHIFNIYTCLFYILQITITCNYNQFRSLCMYMSVCVCVRTDRSDFTIWRFDL